MKRQELLFLDNTFPFAYQQSTLQEQALGGTESSIIKTASILSELYNVFVAQKSRTTTHRESENLSFIPKHRIYKLNPDFIVVLRKYPLLKGLHQQFPNAQLFLWIHTYKNTEYAFKRIGLARTKTTIVCNSKTHALDTYKLLNKNSLGKLFSLISKPAKVSFCYNPIEKPQKIQLERDVNKLLFFSSPNKGLNQVLEAFEVIKKALPDLTLYIANPGYKNNNRIKTNSHIKILGSLPHKEMMKHVRQSLCVFYPQNIFAETFGLIYAEANAYGTPVIAHDIGSAKEILHTNNTLIKPKNYQEMIRTLRKWQINYPKIEYNENFSDETILSQWKELFTNF